MQRIFLDSSVVIAGAFSRTGASRVVLTMAEIGLFQVVISRQVVDECEKNLRNKLPASLPIFAALLTNTNVVVIDDPSPLESTPWLAYIEAKDASIVAAAVQAKVDRLLTLNFRDFTPQVALASGLVIQPPRDFVQELRRIVTQGLDRRQSLQSGPINSG
jgi:predicted nucleic acid-binding protein